MENMSWQAVQNWAIFAPVIAGLAWYYYPRTQVPAKSREPDSDPAATKRKNEVKSKPKPEKKPTSERAPTKPVEETAVIRSGSDNSWKRKNAQKQALQNAAPAAQAQEQVEQDDEVDMSTRQFAQQMQKARQGQKLSASKGNEQRIRTVKQGSVTNRPIVADFEVDADDETLPVAASFQTGDVSDMLEPVASGPKALRVTAPAQAQKERVTRQPKKEEVETKKQRQNRMKVEERRLQREEDEKARKALEERQRRAAREARGEPAKNGLPAKAPATSVWNARPSFQEDGGSVIANGSSDAPLLDTFDAESTSSSNGGLGASTGPSSTTDHDMASEEDQLALAMQQSEYESGWTTVAVPKKQKKKAANEEPAGDNTPVTAPVIPRAAPAIKPVANGKPNGFQALEDQYAQRTDVDPNDASNWDA